MNYDHGNDSGDQAREDQRWRDKWEDRPFGGDPSSVRRYCHCVETEGGTPVGFIRDLDCPDHGEDSSAPFPDALGDPEGAEEAVVARDRARQGAELHGGAGWTRQSGKEEET